MKPFLAAAVTLGLWLVVLPQPCFAMREIAIIAKKDAKEMGLELRVSNSGPDALWVELEFKPEGKLKDYKNVELEIREGEKLLLGYAALSEKRSTTGSVIVRFMANRAFIQKMTLTIVAGVPMNYVGHELPLKDFVELTKAP